jgi:hypothetical protein
MRRLAATLLGALGLWYFVAGSVSLTSAPATGQPVPAMGTGLVLGAALLVAAAMLWRRRPAPVSTDVRTTDRAQQP